MRHIQKRLTMFIRIIVILAGAVAVIVLTTLGASTYLHKISDQKSSQCKQRGVIHEVSIKQNAVMPVTTSAYLCDQLTIQNNDNIERLLSFGQHDHHVAYDGHVSEILKPGQSITLTLIKSGTFRFHDHYDDSVHGTFVVIAK
jgi:signal transduction histidine kinase